jgi:hypothetical protein
MMTGARAILKIDSGNGAGPTIVAFATNVGYRIAIPHAAINTLGRYSAARHEPLGYDVTVNCGVLRFTAAANAGNHPTGASSIQPKLQDIINSDELKIEIIDRKTDEPVVVVDRCRLTDRGGSMNARDLLSENWTFVGVVADSTGEGQQEASAPGTEPPNTEAAQ